MSSRLDRILPRRFVTSDDIRAAASRNEGHVTLPQNCTVTDEARELALKLSIRLDGPGMAKRAVAATPPAARANDVAPASARAVAPEDANRRVVEAVTQVLEGLNLGERKAALLPMIVRRVLAGLEVNRS